MPFNNTAENAAIREEINRVNPEVAKEALIRLTWLGIYARDIRQAIAEAEQIVRVVPQDAYDDLPHPR